VNIGPEHSPGIVALGWKVYESVWPVVRRWLNRDKSVSAALIRAREEADREDREREMLAQMYGMRLELNQALQNIEHLRNWKHDMETAKLVRRASQEMKRIEEEEDKTPT
jgi:hypothetical protein